MNKKEKYMLLAINEAKKALNKTFPNPAVGCVIVKNDKVISVGYHKKAGADHAEIDALKKINFDAKDCEMYVSLEPCNHHGKTPACTKAIIRSGVKKVYVSSKDPNPLVNGSGVNALKNANIDVEVDILKNEGNELIKYFSWQINNKLPYITLKAALSLNACINEVKNERTLLTNSKTYEFTKKLRKDFSAVLVGINTIEVDNPSFLGSDKVVLGNRYLDSNLNIFKTNDKIIQISSKDIDYEARKNFLFVKLDETDILSVLKKLFELNYGSILVEGGEKIFSQFIENNLLNELVLYHAPKFIVGNEKTSFVNLNKNNSSLKLKS